MWALMGSGSDCIEFTVPVGFINRLWWLLKYDILIKFSFKSNRAKLHSHIPSLLFTKSYGNIMQNTELSVLWHVLFVKVQSYLAIMKQAMSKQTLVRLKFRMSFGGKSVIATSPGLQGCVHRTHRNGGGKRIDIRWKLCCGNVLALVNQLAKGFNMTLSVFVVASDFLAALVITHCSTQKSYFLIPSWICGRPNHNHGCSWLWEL